MTRAVFPADVGTINNAGWAESLKLGAAGSCVCCFRLFWSPSPCFSHRPRRLEAAPESRGAAEVLADVVPPLVRACDEGRRDEEEENTHGTCRKAVVARAEPTESRLK